MEAWKERIPNEEDVWKLVHFVKSIGAPEKQQHWAGVKRSDAIGR
jgi:hypothetical protein